jgi:hypothetical protein
MPGLTHERCFHHALREAVARCPECERYFCRECITEHEDRVICASCLRKLVARGDGRRARWSWLLRVAQCLAGLLLCWIVFYYTGRALLAMPGSFHDGTLWKSTSAEEE